VSRRRFLAATAAGVAGAWGSRLAFGEEKSGDTKSGAEQAVDRGLQWLKKAQAGDGHWEASGGAYKTAMTGLAGMAFLMEGSTIRAGRYSEQIQKAAEWLTGPARQQPNGLIAEQRGGSFDNYMHGHGYATMFLACAYGDAEFGDEQRRLERAVTRAVEFTCKAQTLKVHRKPEGKEVEIGGWGYVSAQDGGGVDEGSVTATALQALRAARNAMIPVPKVTIDRALAYLEACTTSNGGVIYQYANARVPQPGEARPPLTAAAVCCGFSAGEYKSELPKRWIKFCRDHLPVAEGRVPHNEYQNYYHAQFVYALGEQRYGTLFPDAPKESWLTWSKYRAAIFPYLVQQQSKDGAWPTSYISPVYATAVNLAILLLEEDLLPIYQR
jgi:hypothetical protein